MPTCAFRLYTGWVFAHLMYILLEKFDEIPSQDKFPFGTCMVYYYFHELQHPNVLLVSFKENQVKSLLQDVSRRMGATEC